MNKSKLALLALCVSLPLLMYSMTPDEQLIEAAKCGNIQQAQEALDAGADINTTCRGLTPLSYPIRSSDIAMIKFLLDFGAYVNAQDRDGLTALHHNVIFRNKRAEDITKLLIASGADVNAQNCLGCTPLHYAVITSLAKDNHIRLLLAAGADINAQDNRGDTSLHYIVRGWNVAKAFLTKFLIDSGARIHLKNQLNTTVLDLASLSGKQELINLLNEIPSLKDLSARALRKRIRQNKLTLDQVKSSVPQELYDLVTEYL